MCVQSGDIAKDRSIVLGCRHPSELAVLVLALWHPPSQAPASVVADIHAWESQPGDTTCSKVVAVVMLGRVLCSRFSCVCVCVQIWRHTRKFTIMLLPLTV